MGFTGNLKTLSFGDILQLVATGKKTGVLILRRQRTVKMIYFRHGNVVAATSESSQEEERLGQLLLRRELLSHQDLEHALKRQRSSGKRLGHVLIELGLLERNVVLGALRSQVEEIVYSLFGWPEGDFEFVDGEAPGSSQVLVELNSLNIMMEGARRFDEYTEIARDLPSAETILRLVPNPRLKKDEVVLTREDIDVLTAIDGTRTVEEIIEGGTHGGFSASKSLHKLLQTNLIEECPEAARRLSQRCQDDQLYDLVFHLYSHSLQAVHKVLVEYLGPLGDRLFFRIPERCSGDGSELISVLTAGTGGAPETFRREVERIADPIRLHRVLTQANYMLSDKIAALRDRLGPALALKLSTKIQKDVGFLLAQRRQLADTYDIAREFQFALKGT